MAFDFSTVSPGTGSSACMSSRRQQLPARRATPPLLRSRSHPVPQGATHDSLVAAFWGLAIMSASNFLIMGTGDVLCDNTL